LGGHDRSRSTLWGLTFNTAAYGQDRYLTM
jgi:hypothetical protein